MTREELKEHCEKTVEQCEMWAIHRGEEPSGKVYEEHKAILDILEQEPCDDAIDREYLFKVLDDFCGHDRTATITLDTLADLVYDMPTVTQKPIECDDAISRLDKIRQIIAIPNSVIQEDVMKYKMICEVMNDDKSVS